MHTSSLILIDPCLNGKETLLNWETYYTYDSNFGYWTAYSKLSLEVKFLFVQKIQVVRSQIKTGSILPWIKNWNEKQPEEYLSGFISKTEIKFYMNLYFKDLWISWSIVTSQDKKQFLNYFG